MKVEPTMVYGDIVMISWEIYASETIYGSIWYNNAIYLVGAWPTPLKNMISSIGMMKIPYKMENKKCLRPPARDYMGI